MSSKDQSSKSEQLDIMKGRLMASGASRRDVIKGAAAIAGGAAIAAAAPGLAADWAEKWEPNEDASVWTFHIRPNNTGWADGKPVTAGDFVYSWARQLDPANGAAYAGFLFDIKYAQAFNTSTAVDDASDPLNGKVPTAADLGIIDRREVASAGRGNLPTGFFEELDGHAFEAAFGETESELRHGLNASRRWISRPHERQRWLRDRVVGRYHRVLAHATHRGNHRGHRGSLRAPLCPLGFL